MYNAILVLLFIIDEVLCDTCYKYSYTYGSYSTYCSGYCSGYSGYQYCYYYYYDYGDYVISGGAIAGLVIGVLAAGAIFVVIVVICIKGGCNKGRPGRVMTTTGGGVGTHVAVTNTSHNPGYMQPMQPMNQYGYSAPPPAYGMMYPPAQQVSPAYPSAPGVQQGYGAPAQPQYSSVYNQPVFGNLPRANM
ncbi:cysteine and tyrosine-rich protein 1-like [Mytilus edulis]|uniref:cysteine and tyrosine-rich protein 1-like n=1 Tax=Mytilus edulis TaxID=6550 RepID=UPI0039EFF3AE